MKLLAAFFVFLLVIKFNAASAKKRGRPRYSVTEGAIGDLKTVTITNPNTGKQESLMLMHMHWHATNTA